jgi:peptidyl-prolyl cis-trans isomerase B (cyclophilin B)
LATVGILARHVIEEINLGEPAMRRYRSMFVAAAVIVVAISIAFAGSATPSQSPPTLPPGALLPLVGPQATQQSSASPTQATPATPVTCTYTPQVPADRFQGLPVFNPTVGSQSYTATLLTTQGDISFQALTAQAPCTTFSFRFLAQHGYFNLTHCQRLTTQHIFVLQCGDPTGTGSGGPGYEFADENLAGATYPAGTVAMANAGPNTNGSQFFITWANTTLPPLYTPFGRVTEGMNVLQRIAAAGDDDQNGPGDGYPNLYVGIFAVSISTSGGLPGLFFP